MDLDSFRRYCLSFPQATENLQWEDELCFKVAGKIFAMLGLDSAPQRLCFKCAPETFAQLAEQEGIIPAPYVGRYKWVLVQGLDVLRDVELKDLIRQSYEMVAAKNKASSRPKRRAVKPKKKNRR